MTEEYTGPKRCDLCKYEKDLPCVGKDCNSVNDLKCFEPKGAPKEGFHKWSISHFIYGRHGDHLLFTLENDSGETLMAELYPDDIATFA